LALKCTYLTLKRPPPITLSTDPTHQPLGFSMLAKECTAM